MQWNHVNYCWLQEGIYVMSFILIRPGWCTCDAQCSIPVCNRHSVSSTQLLKSIQHGLCSVKSLASPCWKGHVFSLGRHSENRPAWPDHRAIKIKSLASRATWIGRYYLPPDGSKVGCPSRGVPPVSNALLKSGSWAWLKGNYIFITSQCLFCDAKYRHLKSCLMQPKANNGSVVNKAEL